MSVYEYGAFSNPWDTWKERSWWEFIKHYFTARVPALPSNLDEVLPVLKPVFPTTPGIHATWLGHATFLVRIHGMNVLFDPVFDRSITPWPWRIFRYRPAPCAIADLPRIDVVCISHDHFDHCSPQEIMELNRRQPDIVWFLPLKLRIPLMTCGLRNVHEMDWWQTFEMDGAAVTFVPSQHWSGRSATRNMTLWGGWVVAKGGSKIYHAGDTGYCPVFKEIGERYGPIDLAMIPIGSCEPREIMRPQHVDAHEAVQIHRDVGAGVSVGMHYGTFQLSSTEGVLSPRDIIREQYADTTFVCVDHGQTISIT